MLKISLLLSILCLSSCASYFFKKDCDRTDWYEYGHTAAMEGRRMSGDRKVRECQDVGAHVDEVAVDQGFKAGRSNYCLPETVFQTGKKGEFFTEDMCEESNALRRKHTEGVHIYCQKGNGFSAGASGRKYNGICPPDLEPTFTPEFNRGRKNFLSAKIAANESAIRDLEVEASRLESEKFMLQSQLMAIPPDVAGTAVATTDPVTGAVFYHQASPNPALQSRRSDLEMRIQSGDSAIRHKRSDAYDLRAANRDFQVEMTGL